MLTDVHIHLHEFNDKEVEEFKDILMVAVSDDYETSMETLRRFENSRNIHISIGIHPWNIGKADLKEIAELERIVDERDVRILGEIGLDKQFTPETFNKQIVFFKTFLKIARERDLIVNLHATGAWKQVFELTLKHDIDKAVFHWYNGPVNLLHEIESVGYFISINPSLKIQNKHRKIALEANIDNILLESDGPYKYRGLNLNPRMVEESIHLIADMRSTKPRDLELDVERNFHRFLGIRF